MNTQHRDIITTIGRKQPITTAGIAEYLMDHFGYGGGMEFDTFRDQVSKAIGYLQKKGDVTGEDHKPKKGRPVKHWSIANPQPDCQSADHYEHDLEMASDVAEVEAVNEKSSETIQENLTVADDDMIATLDSLDTEREIQERQAVAEVENADDGCLEDIHGPIAITAVKSPTPEPTVSVDVTVAHKLPISVPQALANFAGLPHDLNAFMRGIEFAEKHHGIGQ